MEKQVLDDQLEPIYNSFVPIQDVAWKTSRERWTIETGGEGRSGKSALAARHDDNTYVYIYMYIYIIVSLVRIVNLNTSAKHFGTFTFTWKNTKESLELVTQRIPTHFSV